MCVQVVGESPDSTRALKHAWRHRTIVVTRTACHLNLFTRTVSTHSVCALPPMRLRRNNRPPPVAFHYACITRLLLYDVLCTRVYVTARTIFCSDRLAAQLAGAYTIHPQIQCYGGSKDGHFDASFNVSLHFTYTILLHYGGASVTRHGPEPTPSLALACPSPMFITSVLTLVSCPLNQRI